MSRSRRTAKDAGTRFERLVADYLAGRLGADIDRQVKTGSHDTGDIRGVSVAGRGIAIECKDYQGRHELPKWLREAETERRNRGADYGVVVWKRRGTAIPGEQFVTMTLETFAAFEVDTEDSAAFDAIRKSGEEVWLSIQSKQPQILFVSHDGEVTE